MRTMILMTAVGAVAMAVLAVPAAAQNAPDDRGDHLMLQARDRVMEESQTQLGEAEQVGDAVRDRDRTRVRAHAAEECDGTCDGDPQQLRLRHREHVGQGDGAGVPSPNRLRMWDGSRWCTQTPR